MNDFFNFDKINRSNRYLNIDHNYVFEACMENYIPTKSKISTHNLETSKKFIEELILYPKDVAIDLPQVRYDYDDTVLQVIENQVDSRDSLDYLYDLMLENPGLLVELQAHTDCRGSKSYNLELSQGRANSCVEYLIAKGIKEERLVPVGNREVSPIKTLECNSINKMATSEEQEAAHQRNRKTQFKILSSDFK